MDSAQAAGLRPSSHTAIEINEVARDFADWRAWKREWIMPRRPCNDVREATAKNILKGMPPGQIVVVGGIPCTSRSVANTAAGRGAERTAEGTESGLVREFARVLAELRASGRDVKFVAENFPSAAEADKVFNDFLGVEPVVVNAAAFGAQSRRRLFWANFGIVPREQPTAKWSRATFRDIAEENPIVRTRYTFIHCPSPRPKPFAPARVGILLNDRILKTLRATGGGVSELQGIINRGCFGHGVSMTEISYDDKHKSPVVRAHTDGRPLMLVGQTERIHDPHRKSPSHIAHHTGRNHFGKMAVASSVQDRVYSPSGKMKTIPALAGGRTEGLIGVGEAVETDFGGGLVLPVVENDARCITITECERLFGLPDGETAQPRLSVSARKRLLGGGWHREQMAHCLRCLDFSAGLV